MARRKDSEFSEPVSVALILVGGSLGLVCLLSLVWWVGSNAYALLGWLIATWRVLS